MNDGQQDVCICPSFNSYSSEGLAETAVRVAGGASQHGGDDDFEFALDAAEESYLYDGQIGPVFPVFNRDLLRSDGESSSMDNIAPPQSESNAVISLNQLFVEEDNNERDYNPPSCSSSEADELESIPAETYCVWRPRTAEPPLPSRCKKSKSTGSGSKRWKLRDLSRRSKSDGKESFVFLTPKLHREDKPEKTSDATKQAANSAVAAAGAQPSAHAAFYVRNRAMKEGDKKKSYLPYRQDIVGLFANVNGTRRTFPPF